jgi:hypothetical protein
MSGKVFMPRGFDWDRGIPSADRVDLLRVIQRLSAWVGNELGTDDLNIRKLADADGLWRLRSGGTERVLARVRLTLHRVGC